MYAYKQRVVKGTSLLTQRNELSNRKAIQKLREGFNHPLEPVLTSNAA